MHVRTSVVVAEQADDVLLLLVGILLCANACKKGCEGTVGRHLLHQLLLILVVLGVVRLVGVVIIDIALGEGDHH